MSDTEDSSEITYALIHEASEIDDFDKLSNPNSVESGVARGRGKGSVNDVTYPDDKNEEPKYSVSIEQGVTNVKTGYVIRFVKEKHLSLTPFDIVGMDSIKAYPASEKVIESLTPQIRGHLKDKGYVKIRGAYSSSSSRFYGVQLGWEVDDEVDPWDRIMEVIDQVSTTPAAVDYVFINDGPDRWDVEEVAETRGVKESSVRGNLRAVENEIDDNL